jgi:hypothetical protein
MSTLPASVEPSEEPEYHEFDVLAASSRAGDQFV